MLALRPSRSSTPLLHQIPFAAMFKLLVTLSEVYILSKQVAELKTHLVPMTVAQLRSTASIIIKIHANIWLLSITLTLSHHQPNPSPPLCRLLRWRCRVSRAPWGGWKMVARRKPCQQRTQTHSWLYEGTNGQPRWILLSPLVPNLPRRRAEWKGERGAIKATTYLITLFSLPRPKKGEERMSGKLEYKCSHFHYML